MSRRSFLISAAAASIALLPRSASANANVSPPTDQPPSTPLPDTPSSVRAGGLGRARLAELLGIPIEELETRREKVHAQLIRQEAISRISHPQLGWIEPPQGALLVPYVSQYDDTPWARSNCGPASLSMLLAHCGVLALPAAIRQDVIRRTGNRSVGAGTAWDTLAAIASSRRLQQRGLYSRPKAHRHWSFANLDEELGRGFPVMILVRFPLLPGRSGEAFRGDHYSVVVGRDRSGRYYYHDPAVHELEGAYLEITKAQLNRAWTQTSSGLVRTGMVVYSAK